MNKPLIRGTGTLSQFIVKNPKGEVVSTRFSVSIGGASVVGGLLTDGLIAQVAALATGPKTKANVSAKPDDQGNTTEGWYISLGDVEATDCVVEETHVPAKRDALGNVIVPESVTRAIVELSGIRRWTRDLSPLAKLFA